jgi:hypothetical protein
MCRQQTPACLATREQDAVSQHKHQAIVFDWLIAVDAVVLGYQSMCSRVLLFARSMSAAQQLAQHQGNVAVGISRIEAPDEAPIMWSQTPLSVLADVCARENESCSLHIPPVSEWPAVRWVEMHGNVCRPAHARARAGIRILAMIRANQPSRQSSESHPQMVCDLYLTINLCGEVSNTETL